MKLITGIGAKRALARKDPIMAAIIRSRPKVFLARRGEPFVTLSRAIVGQQISVKAAQSVWDKVCLCAGAVTPQSVLQEKGASCAPAACRSARSVHRRSGAALPGSRDPRAALARHG